MILAKLDATLTPQQLEDAQSAGCRIFSSFSRYQVDPLGELLPGRSRERLAMNLGGEEAYGADTPIRVGQALAYLPLKEFEAFLDTCPEWQAPYIHSLAWPVMLKSTKEAFSRLSRSDAKSENGRQLGELLKRLNKFDNLINFDDLINIEVSITLRHIRNSSSGIIMDLDSSTLKHEALRHLAVAVFQCAWPFDSVVSPTLRMSSALDEAARSIAHSAESVGVDVLRSRAYWDWQEEQVHDLRISPLIVTAIPVPDVPPKAPAQPAWKRMFAKMAP